MAIEQNSTIDNASLTLADIPGENAGLGEIYDFALTYDGYKESGSFAACAAIAREGRHDTLSDLRTCLFFAQRAQRFMAHGYPLSATQEEMDRIMEKERVAEERELAYLRGLIEKIRQKVALNERG